MFFLKKHLHKRSDNAKIEPCESSSTVERYLPKVVVASSNLVFRSNSRNGVAIVTPFSFSIERSYL